MARAAQMALLLLSRCSLAFVVTPLGLHTPQPRTVSISMGSTTDFKVGLTIEFEGSVSRFCGNPYNRSLHCNFCSPAFRQVWRVQEFLHVKPGKGPAFVRSTLKNIQTGKTLDKTWRAGETFPDAQVVRTADANPL